MILYRGVFLTEAPDGQVPGHLQELLQLLLQHLGLALVAEGQQCLQLAKLHPPQVEQRVGVTVFDQH